MRVVEGVMSMAGMEVDMVEEGLMVEVAMEVEEAVDTVALVEVGAGMEPALEGGGRRMPNNLSARSFSLVRLCVGT